MRNAIDADLQRRPSGFGRLTLVIFRLGQYVANGHGVLPRLLKPAWLVADRVWTRAIIGAELPSAMHCGPGLALPHAGRGVIVHPNASIGSNSMIFHGVTLGTHGSDAAPQLANDVLVGAGAVVIGAVQVGEHAQIGANAVVTRDVEPWTSVAGIPATKVADRQRPAGAMPRSPS
jgi:serine O-acetyltransferase